MEFSTILIIYIAIGIFALISIVLSISNWLKLNATTNEISKLQTIIEKKTKEFDLKKKESIKHSHLPNNLKEIDATDTRTLVQNIENQPNIEIVRNIRQDFNTGETPLSEQSPTSFNRSPHHSFTKNDQQGHLHHSTNKDTDKDIVIPLYSNSSKDADFQKLWETINKALTKNNHLHITIDFNNIMFLYDKEIEYLKKIYHILRSQRNSLSLAYCSPDLKTRIQKETLLNNLIKAD